MRVAGWLVALWLSGGLPALATAQVGTLEGTVELGVAGLELAQVGPVVVYLESDTPQDSAIAAQAAAVLRQRSARFTPSFLVVAVGQRVGMPNEDDIYHNVFSFSAPNAFDLGLYAGGESRSIRFEHPGPVNLYCSIHESMNGTIFVAPTPWFALTDAEGRFAIRDVPHGRFRLRTWAEQLPETERRVQIGREVQRADIRIVGSPPARPAP